MGFFLENMEKQVSQIVIGQDEDVESDDGSCGVEDPPLSIVAVVSHDDELNVGVEVVFSHLGEHDFYDLF